MREDEGRDSWLYEYFAYEGKVPTCMAVRTDRYKLVIFPRNPELQPELYDLREDPGETTNRLGDPALRAVAVDLQNRLERRLVETGFRWPEPVTPTREN
jgi:arylsulfatase A-like enzyme